MLWDLSTWCYVFLQIFTCKKMLKWRKGSYAAWFSTVSDKSWKDIRHQVWKCSPALTSFVTRKTNCLVLNNNFKFKCGWKRKETRGCINRPTSLFFTIILFASLGARKSQYNVTLPWCHFGSVDIHVQVCTVSSTSQDEERVWLDKQCKLSLCIYMLSEW